MRLEREKQIPPVGWDDQILAQLHASLELVAVFSQASDSPRRTQRTQRNLRTKRNVIGAFVLADRLGRRSLHRQERKVIG
jgi:hypothetical protein